MGKCFRVDDLDQSLLLPPSLHDWLPEKHLARFVGEVAQTLNLSAFYRSYNEKDGRGQAAYHPVMMARLLLYGYCVGVFSSRLMERRTYEDVAFRYLSADEHPDHSTIQGLPVRIAAKKTPQGTRWQQRSFGPRSALTSPRPPHFSPRPSRRHISHFRFSSRFRNSLMASTGNRDNRRCPAADRAGWGDGSISTVGSNLSHLISTISSTIPTSPTRAPALSLRQRWADSAPPHVLSACRSVATPPSTLGENIGSHLPDTRRQVEPAVRHCAPGRTPKRL